MNVPQLTLNFLATQPLASVQGLSVPKPTPARLVPSPSVAEHARTRSA